MNRIEQLTKLVKYGAKVMPKRGTLPILSCICVKDGKAWVTDLQTTVMVPVDIEGSFVIPFKTLKKILDCKPSFVNITSDGEKNTIVYDGGKLSLVAMDVGEFPKIPKNDYSSLGDWQGEMINNLIASVPFLSKDELKPSLMGVYVKQIENSAEFCATDGHRLRLAESVANEGGNFDGVINIDWLKILSKKEQKQPLNVSAGESHLKVEFDDVIILSSLINERYPDYKSILPDKFGGSVTVNRADLLEIIKNGRRFANSITKQGQFTFTPHGVRVLIEDIEQSTEWTNCLDVSKHEGEPIPVGFNLTFLETVVKALATDEIIINYAARPAPRLDDGHQPEYGVTASIFQEVGSESKVTCLLMPIRLDNN
jgi:DNA polymerase-3 subunit beta